MNICKYIVMNAAVNPYPAQARATSASSSVPAIARAAGASSSTPAKASAAGASSSRINFLAILYPGMGLVNTFYNSSNQSAPGQAIAYISEKFDAIQAQVEAACSKGQIEGSEKAAKATAENLVAFTKMIGDLFSGIGKLAA
jgi:hypothetical protein